MCKGYYDPSFVNQDHLYQVLQRLFPNEKSAYSNARKVAQIKSAHSHYSLEIDVWFPTLKLCFEFQDIYHYTTTWYSHTPLEIVCHSDLNKKRQIFNRGDTLIVVPCWWNGELQSLWATIAHARPDLQPETHSKRKSSNNYKKKLRLISLDLEPIPLNPPLHFFKETVLPDVGDLMLASFPPTVMEMKAKTNCFISEHNPWWVGEKYDGVRSCWHPIHKKMYNRRGGEINLFKSDNCTTLHLLNIFADGELWYGRGTFINSPTLTHLNAFMCFIAFDSPTPFVQNLPFEHRYSMLLHATIFLAMPIVAMRLLCREKRQMSVLMARVIHSGGEGVILRKPLSVYQHGRTTNLLKLKGSYQDQEALVVQGGTKTAPFILQLISGDLFEVTPKNVQTRPWPVQGDVVTFKYETNSQKTVLKKAIVTRIREDLAWKDVCAVANLPMNGHFQNNIKSSIRTWNQQASAHKIFEEIANNWFLDPKHPNTWYILYKDPLFVRKTEMLVQQDYNGNIVNALLNAFPNIGLDKDSFIESYDIGNRRNFFFDFARRKGSDALIPEFWYNVSGNSIRNHKGTLSILHHYNGDLSVALLHLFPEVKWNISHLKSNLSWINISNKKEFLTKFAHHCGFDPLIALNWHSMKWKQMKVYQKFPLFNKQMFAKTLLQVFPNIGLDAMKFSFLPGNNLTADGYWITDDVSKDLFVQFANDNGFDPLVPKNWYSVSLGSIQDKTMRSIIQHKGGLVKTLWHLFPDIGLERDKFWFHKFTPKEYPSKYWKDNQNRKKFFLHYAAKNRFDPLVPENWYLCTSSNVRKFEGGMSVLFYYKKSLIKALLHLFPDIGLDSAKFTAKQKSFWQDIDNQRKFCVQFAESRSLNPLIAENWYSIPADEFLAEGGHGALVKNKFSLHKLINNVFPELILDATLFKKLPRNHWADKQNRKTFFVRFAHEQEFDPLEPKNWHKFLYQSKSVLTTKKGARGLLQYYQNNCYDALLDVFPDIGLDAEKLKGIQL